MLCCPMVSLSEQAASNGAATRRASAPRNPASPSHLRRRRFRQGARTFRARAPAVASGSALAGREPLRLCGEARTGRMRTVVASLARSRPAMAVLLSTDPAAMEDWRNALLAEDPGLDVRRFPDARRSRRHRGGRGLDVARHGGAAPLSEPPAHRLHGRRGGPPAAPARAAARRAGGAAEGRAADAGHDGVGAPQRPALPPAGSGVPRPPGGAPMGGVAGARHRRRAASAFWASASSAARRRRRCSRWASR